MGFLRALFLLHKKDPVDLSRAIQAVVNGHVDRVEPAALDQPIHGLSLERPRHREAESDPRQGNSAGLITVFEAQAGRSPL